MQKSLLDSLSAKSPDPASRQPLSSGIHPAIQITMYKYGSKRSGVSETTTTTNTMAAAKTAPLEIGSRGTVGSLIRQEIEYFRRCNQHPAPKQPGVALAPKPKVGSLAAYPSKKKKKKGSSGGSRLIPSMCSMVEVADSGQQPNAFPKFAYRNLKTDLTRLQV